MSTLNPSTSSPFVPPPPFSSPPSPPLHTPPSLPSPPLPPLPYPPGYPPNPSISYNPFSSSASEAVVGGLFAAFLLASGLYFLFKFHQASRAIDQARQQQQRLDIETARALAAGFPQGSLPPGMASAARGQGVPPFIIATFPLKDYVPRDASIATAASGSTIDRGTRTRRMRAAATALSMGGADPNPYSLPQQHPQEPQSAGFAAALPGPSSSGHDNAVPNAVPNGLGVGLRSASMTLPSSSLSAQVNSSKAAGVRISVAAAAAAVSSSQPGQAAARSAGASVLNVPYTGSIVRGGDSTAAAGGSGHDVLHAAAAGGSGHDVLHAAAAGGSGHDVLHAAAAGGSGHDVLHAAAAGGSGHDVLHAAAAGGIGHDVLHAAAAGGSGHDVLHAAAAGSSGHDVLHAAAAGGSGHVLHAAAQGQQQARGGELIELTTVHAEHAPDVQISAPLPALRHSPSSSPHLDGYHRQQQQQQQQAVPDLRSGLITVDQQALAAAQQASCAASGSTPVRLPQRLSRFLSRGRSRQFPDSSPSAAVKRQGMGSPLLDEHRDRSDAGGPSSSAAVPLGLAVLPAGTTGTASFTHQQEPSQSDNSGMAPSGAVHEEGRHSASNEEDADRDMCTICLLTFEMGDRLRVLPCGHDFHQPCIDSWMRHHMTCPLCRNLLWTLLPTTLPAPLPATGVYQPPNLLSGTTAMTESSGGTGGVLPAVSGTISIQNPLPASPTSAELLGLQLQNNQQAVQSSQHWPSVASHQPQSPIGCLLYQP
ncbi:hypothetical protein CEUSTIGMA_g11583.t1 [Chlamydomonas eustigma]|uniref:RING-type domain-containing protein n=1 Tax=Chlamydomonas eustigma TaxID=1157962 RepID=A0A250XMY0_9CHLO|nr:hypothetical protein CEUSTIGMA_g11583.t1 [Chlamydomonas eustigma]|eukprot:GAX84160.1 hypothetical protein CEUSTIGMA_g11583.t1 [Chlamydomonas eustigma]